MSVLGYSEIIKEIYGITPESIENEIALLLKSKPTKVKIQLLKKLAQAPKATVSELMRKEKLNNTGGSFRSIKKFFNELSKLGIIEKEIIGRRTYFKFKEKSSLSKWLQVE